MINLILWNNYYKLLVISRLFSTATDKKIYCTVIYPKNGTAINFYTITDFRDNYPTFVNPVISALANTFVFFPTLIIFKGKDLKKHFESCLRSVDFRTIKRFWVFNLKRPTLSPAIFFDKQALVEYLEISLHSLKVSILKFLPIKNFFVCITKPISKTCTFQEIVFQKNFALFNNSDAVFRKNLCYNSLTQPLFDLEAYQSSFLKKWDTFFIPENFEYAPDYSSEKEQYWVLGSNFNLQRPHSLLCLKSAFRVPFGERNSLEKAFINVVVKTKTCTVFKGFNLTTFLVARAQAKRLIANQLFFLVNINNLDDGYTLIRGVNRLADFLKLSRVALKKKLVSFQLVVGYYIFFNPPKGAISYTTLANELALAYNDYLYACAPIDFRNALNLEEKFTWLFDSEEFIAQVRFSIKNYPKTDVSIIPLFFSGTAYIDAHSSIKIRIREITILAKRCEPRFESRTLLSYYTAPEIRDFPCYIMPEIKPPADHIPAHLQVLSAAEAGSIFTGRSIDYTAPYFTDPKCGVFVKNKTIIVCYLDPQTLSVPSDILQEPVNETIVFLGAISLTEAGANYLLPRLDANIHREMNCSESLLPKELMCPPEPYLYFLVAKFMAKKLEELKIMPRNSIEYKYILYMLPQEAVDWSTERQIDFFLSDRTSFKRLGDSVWMKVENYYHSIYFNLIQSCHKRKTPRSK